MIKKWKFKGVFKVDNKSNKEYYLYNNAFYLENSIFWRGIDYFLWELKSREIWIHLSKKSEIILDIGANTGIYSILSKVHNFDSNVYAFEPQPNIFEILKKNAQINNFDITCIPYAISNDIGEFSFYNYGDNTFLDNNTTAGSLNKDWRKNNQHSIIVPVTTLKQYIKDCKLEKIDLIKIDVETLEFEVLKGFGKYLNQFLPIIILEIQTNDIGEKIKTLLDSSYNIFNIDEQFGLIQNHNWDKNLNKNYILCPDQALHLISDFIYDRK